MKQIARVVKVNHYELQIYFISSIFFVIAGDVLSQEDICEMWRPLLHVDSWVSLLQTWQVTLLKSANLNE